MSKKTAEDGDVEDDAQSLRALKVVLQIFASQTPHARAGAVGHQQSGHAAEPSDDLPSSSYFHVTTGSQAAERLL